VAQFEFWLALTWGLALPISLHGPAAATRLGRNGVHAPCDWVFAEMVAKLEGTGEAMRFVDAKGRVAWKASPQLRSHLKDLKLDAQADLRDV
jgi:hypothetical protein